MEKGANVSDNLENKSVGSLREEDEEGGNNKEALASDPSSTLTPTATLASLTSIEPGLLTSTSKLNPPKTTDEQQAGSALSTAEIIAQKQKQLQQESLRRVMNPPKLERKHSSGDLHSRLKTRKILGVGETDNGDIHRSKISQVLGHNEHLYVKFPRGVWNWQAFLSGLLLVQALLILFFPRQASQLKLLGIQQQQEKEGLMIASKYYAVSLLALSFILWRFMFIRDKGVARTIQLAALIHFSSLCVIDLVSVASTEVSHLYDTTLLTVMGVRMGTVLICSIYLSRIGRATSGLRKSPSYRDLGESMKKDG